MRAAHPVRRRLWSLLLALLTCCACAINAAEKAPRVVINYWEKWSGAEAEAMQAIVNDFNRSQNRIEVRFLSVTPIDVKLLLAASSGHPPDLAGLWSFSIPDFSEKGALLPLDAALADSGLNADHYVPLFWELCRHQGFTWGLPTTPGCVALFYNKRLFRAAGLDPERPPQTFAELESMSRRLTMVETERGGRRIRLSFADLTPAEREGKRYAIVQLGHFPYDAGMFLSAWGYWFGATYYHGDRRILANEAGNIAAYRRMQESVLTYGSQNLRDFGASFGQSQTSQSPFLAGLAGMVVQGPWLRNFIAKYAPDLEWGVTPCPAAPGVSDHAPTTVVETDVIVIPKGAKHRREAFQFIRYLQQQEVAEKLAASQGKFTALKNVSASFVQRHPNPAIATFVDLARSSGARAVPRLSIWREYDMELTIAAERVRMARNCHCRHGAAGRRAGKRRHVFHRTPLAQLRRGHQSDAAFLAVLRQHGVAVRAQCDGHRSIERPCSLRFFAHRVARSRTCIRSVARDHDDSVSGGDGAAVRALPRPWVGRHAATPVGWVFLRRGVQRFFAAAVFSHAAHRAFGSGAHRWVRRVPYLLANYAAALPTGPGGRWPLHVSGHVERFSRTAHLPDRPARLHPGPRAAVTAAEERSHRLALPDGCQHARDPADHHAVPRRSAELRRRHCRDRQQAMSTPFPASKP